jgi:hypothetical protein
MTLGPDPVSLETRLDALGRAMATDAAAEPPAAFVGLVKRRRRVIAVRRAGAGACGALVLALLVMAAQQNRQKLNPIRPEITAPTFASMRTLEDVDAAARVRAAVVPAIPVARAGERSGGNAWRQLVEFK